MIGRLTVATLLVATGCTGIAGDRTAEQAVTDYLDATNSGDVEGALQIMDGGAVWVLNGFEISLDEPLAEEFGWLSVAMGLDSNARFSDAIAAMLHANAVLGTTASASDCEGDASTVRCAYRVVDATTALSGLSEAGVVTVHVSSDHITRWETATVTSGVPAPEWDHFRRWVRVEEPTFTIEDAALLDAEGLVALISRWEQSGRPDIPRPPVPLDPVAVVYALLEAHASRDWRAWTGLLSGAALEAELGTWDDFRAAEVLERSISPQECDITLANEQAGAVVACRVVVADIILTTADIEGTQWNRSTFHVKDGLVTSLPVFIPSSAVAERAIEEWAATERPIEFLAACPDGIVDATGTEDLLCAQFIVRNQLDWSPLVAGILGASG